MKGGCDRDSAYRHGSGSTHTLTAHLTFLSLSPRVSTLVIIDDPILVQVNRSALLDGVGSKGLGLGESLGENGLGVFIGLTAEFLLSARDCGSLVDC